MFEKQSGSLQETASATGVAVPHAQESCVIYFFFFAAHSDLGEILTPIIVKHEKVPSELMCEFVSNSKTSEIKLLL